LSAIRVGLLVALSGAIGGCGLYVPEIQENPFDGPQGQQFVQEIIENITCEVQDSLYDIYARERQFDPNYVNLSFMNGWGVTIALTLTIDEKGSLNPLVSWLPTGTPTTPSSIFSLNLGATLSSEAQRIEKLNSFFLVSDLIKNPCSADERNHGPFILENNLKLEEWLDDVIQAGVTGFNKFPTDANGPLKSNVLSHEVKFDIISSGNLTPGWKLKQSTINQSGNFFTASRDRTQDLVITFGPAMTTSTKDKNGKTVKLIAPSPVAADALLASEIGVAVSNGVRNALQQ
jgi:hypothetical protein